MFSRLRPALPRSPLAPTAVASLTVLALVSACGPRPASPAEAEATTTASAEAPAPATVAGVPVIAADEPTFEFGALAPGESVTHVFEIVNRGGADLHIEGVERT